MAEVSAGELRDRVELLELVETDGTFGWQVRKRTWAKAELSEKTNLFSKVGVGARQVVFTLRRQPLSLHEAIRWRGRHCFLTSIVPDGLGHLTVSAALVDLVPCVGCANKTPRGPAFPGVLTEKYLKHDQETPMATNTLTYVLVTPKAIALEPGPLVEVAGTAYKVTVAHTLDEYKNEYEITRKGDL